jgi:L-alanine-DL-glutamate epimerase-like enolase superfamily enzyme
MPTGGRRFHFSMTRRFFLGAFALPAVLRAVARPQHKITRITVAPILGRFHKFVAMNSYDTAPKGHTYTNHLVRIFTGQGVEGVGVMAYDSPDESFLAGLRELLGADPLQLYELYGGRVVGRSPAHAVLLEKYPHLDGPLFDLIGKLTGKPVWQLIGGAARDRVEVYDGTLYFSDVWFHDRGVQAVLEEAEEAVKSGYRGMKFKVGRGWKWMPRVEGLRRDIEVLKAARKALGGEVKILADANNGFRQDFEGVWRLLEETRDTNLYWMEEPFPEDIEQYSLLKDRMERAGMRTFIADGENLRRPAEFAPYLRPRRLMDVLQMDIRVGGFLGNLEMARMGDEAGALSVPHNWGSQVGLWMSLHLAKAVPSVVAAEDDRSTCDVLEAEGYEFKGGFYAVSDAPGLGLRVSEEIYREKYAAAETVIA